MISSFSKRYLINTHHHFSEVRRARISLMLTDRRLNIVGPSKEIAFSEKTPHNRDLESHNTLSPSYIRFASGLPWWIWRQPHRDIQCTPHPQTAPPISSTITTPPIIKLHLQQVSARIPSERKGYDLRQKRHLSCSGLLLQ